MPNKKTTVLIVLDGWGYADPKRKGNVITPATAPNYFSWLKKYPHNFLAASGEAVGLFKGQEGNSEAGHLNLGAGRVVKQDALYISDAIKDGTFYKNNAFEQAVHHVQKYGTAVHVMGLLSNHNSGHSCPEHLYALLDYLHRMHVTKVFLHLFTDGRDSGQHDAPVHYAKLEKYLHGNEQVATVMGRYYAMDRNKIWDRTRLAYEALVLGKGTKVTSVSESITRAYNKGETDEFIEPSVITDKSGKPVATIKDNDAVFFFNLRSDRARQLTKAFVQPNLARSANGDVFKRLKKPTNIRFVAMTDFGPDLPSVLTAYPSRDVARSLTAVICPRPQLYVAESEKFAHVTYFFNGGYADKFCDERRVKIDTPNIRNFADQPAMSATAVGAVVRRGIESGDYDFICANFANADMVGHAGNLAAGTKAVAVIDSEVAKIIDCLKKFGGQGIITADHGNIEDMINATTGEIDTEHSVNPVPVILVASQWPKVKLRKGKLADVAPTILKLMGIKKPQVMTGKSLF
ncbi:MAG: 2,3-bisphosphoglycerate-independent phosphoglycerate mutase [bacterium]|nr:2,3-bisphosphoglycerate-independent phosphoglycerate mutase [bacterium]